MSESTIPVIWEAVIIYACAAVLIWLFVRSRNKRDVSNRYMLPFVAVLAFAPGCSTFRDQATAAANIEVMAGMVPAADDQLDRMALARGITAEAAAVRETLDADAQPTISPSMPPQAASAAAVSHAGSVRTPLMQTYDQYGAHLLNWGLGAAGLGGAAGVAGLAIRSLLRRRRGLDGLDNLATILKSQPEPADARQAQHEEHKSCQNSNPQGHSSES